MFDTTCILKNQTNSKNQSPSHSTNNKEFSNFCVTQKGIIVFITTRNEHQFWAKQINLTPFNPTTLRPILILRWYLRLCLPSCPFLYTCLSKFCMNFFPFQRLAQHIAQQWYDQSHLNLSNLSKRISDTLRWTRVMRGGRKHEVRWSKWTK